MEWAARPGAARADTRYDRHADARCRACRIPLDHPPRARGDGRCKTRTPIDAQSIGTGSSRGMTIFLRTYFSARPRRPRASESPSTRVSRSATWRKSPLAPSRRWPWKKTFKLFLASTSASATTSSPAHPVWASQCRRMCVLRAWPRRLQSRHATDDRRPWRLLETEEPSRPKRDLRRRFPPA